MLWRCVNDSNCVKKKRYFQKHSTGWGNEPGVSKYIGDNQ